MLGDAIGAVEVVADPEVSDLIVALGSFERRHRSTGGRGVPNVPVASARWERVAVHELASDL